MDIKPAYIALEITATKAKLAAGHCQHGKPILLYLGEKDISKFMDGTKIVDAAGLAGCLTGFALIDDPDKRLKMTVDQVEAIAQGHVFTGEDALKIKLVDELGGLDKAVAKAAQLAKVDEYYTAAYPTQPSLFEQLMNQANGGNYLDEQLRVTLGEYYKPFMLMREASQMSPVQARLPYYLNIR